MEIKNHRHKITHATTPYVARAPNSFCVSQMHVTASIHQNERPSSLLLFVKFYFYIHSTALQCRNVQPPKTEFSTTEIKCQLPVFCTNPGYFTVCCRAQKTVVCQKRQRRSYDLVDVKPARLFGTNFDMSKIPKKLIENSNYFFEEEKSRFIKILAEFAKSRLPGRLAFFR